MLLSIPRKFSLYFSEISKSSYEFWKFKWFFEIIKWINQIQKIESEFKGHRADSGSHPQLVGHDSP
jgi:hypothetical protein